MQEKYCSYYQQNVVISIHNKNGCCSCLNCNKPECTSDCSASVHAVRISAKSRTGKIFWRRNKCNDCIKTTLEYTSGMQR